MERWNPPRVTIKGKNQAQRKQTGDPVPTRAADGGTVEKGVGADNFEKYTDGAQWGSGGPNDR